MRAALSIILTSLLWPGTNLRGQDDSPASNGHVAAKEAGFVVENAAGSLVLPRNERLVYRVKIDFGDRAYRPVSSK